MKTRWETMTKGGELTKLSLRVLRLLLCVSVLLPAFAPVRQAFASFEELPAGARAAGMADAYTVVADDALSLYYNPAGLVHVRRPELSSYYSRLFLGLTDKSEISRSFLGYAQPLGKDRGTVGVGYVNLSLPGLYSEDSLGVSYGRELMKRWNAGATVKMLRRSFGSDPYTQNAINVDAGGSRGGGDPLFEKGNSRTAIGLDLGTQYKLSQNYALGFAARNINQPDLSLGSGNDRAPAIYSFGLGRWTRTSSLSVEMSERKFGGSQDMRTKLGGEKWFRNGFGMRAGLATGSRGFGEAAAGLSYRMDGFQFDYGMNFPLKGIQSIGSQMLSITFRFGKPAADPVEAQLNSEHEARLRAEAEMARLRQQLVELTDKPIAAPDSRGVDSAVQDALKAAETEIHQMEAEPAYQEPVEPVQPAIAAPRPVEETFQAAPALPPAVATPLPAVERPAPKSVLPKPQKPRAAHPTLTPGLMSQYSESLKYYADQVKSGAPVEARVLTLKRILEKYENQGINTSAIRSELKKLEGQNNKVSGDYELAISYYRKLVQQGTKGEEQAILLDRIIKKYKPIGVDTSALEKELQGLRK